MNGLNNSPKISTKRSRTRSNPSSTKLPSRSTASSRKQQTSITIIDDSGPYYRNKFIPHSHPLPTLSSTPSNNSPTYNLARILECARDSDTGLETYLVVVASHHTSLWNGKQASAGAKPRITQLRVVPEQILDYVSPAELEIFETQAERQRDIEQETWRTEVRRRVGISESDDISVESSAELSSKHSAQGRRGGPPKVNTTSIPSTGLEDKQVTTKKRRKRRRKNTSGMQAGFPFPKKPRTPKGSSRAAPHKNDKLEDSENDSSEGEGEICEVARIIDAMLHPDQAEKQTESNPWTHDPADYYYLVEWVGYENLEDLTWEPLENLRGSMELVQDFWATKGGLVLGKGKGKGKGKLSSKSPISSRRQPTSEVSF